MGRIASDENAAPDDITVRLRRQVDIMMNALELFDPPKDHLGVERMAKAVIAVKKAHDLLSPDKDSDNDETRELDAMHNEPLPPTEGPDAVDAWHALLERKLAPYVRRTPDEPVDCDAYTDREPGVVSGGGLLDAARAGAAEGGLA